jgi:hypothetical protein
MQATNEAKEYNFKIIINKLNILTTWKSKSHLKKWFTSTNSFLWFFYDLFIDSSLHTQSKHWSLAILLCILEHFKCAHNNLCTSPKLVTEWHDTHLRLMSMALESSLVFTYLWNLWVWFSVVSWGGTPVRMASANWKVCTCTKSKSTSLDFIAIKKRGPI